MTADAVSTAAGDVIACPPGRAVSLALRPHQQAAFDDATRHLGEYDRVTIALPCGTGKTLLGQRLAQQQARHGRSSILVLVPTLALLSQTLRAWTRHSPRPLAPFVFCHDAAVGGGDIRVPVSTSPAALADWVSRTHRHIRRPGDPQLVVFATYQSSPKIAEAHQRHGLAPWHAVVADEAHCCAGQFEAAFATVVDDAKIPAAVRIFLTATPRIRGDRSATAFCMDNVDAFGPIVAPLAVRAAIDARLLSDYVVAVVAVTDRQVREALAAGRAVKLGDQARPGQQVATQIAVTTAAQTYGLRRIMVFHNSVAASMAFTDCFGETLHRQDQTAALVAMHIDGSTPARQRAERLATLAEPGPGRWAVLSNVRCLGMGIDVPALDGVVFAAPRTSQIDITQCVGRALRLDPARPGPAVIVLPVLVDAGEDLATQVAGSGFKHVLRTLLALADQDTELAGELTGAQHRRRGRAAGAHVGHGDRVQILTAAGAPDADQLRAALQVRTLKLLTPGWDFAFEQLAAFANEHGHTRVPASYTTDSGYPLGAWVRGQRRRRAHLSGDRAAALGAMPGWAWNQHDAAWQDAFDRLTAFATEHGHTRLPRAYRAADGFALHQWASVQRSEYRTGTLSAQRAALLETLPGWQWQPADARWQLGYAALEVFTEATGQASPSQNNVAADGFRLGEWTKNQRRAYAHGQLDSGRVAALEKLPGWVWDVREARWRAGLAELIAFRGAHGHLRVPRNHITPSGEPLGKWVDNQKNAQRAGTLTSHRRQLLHALDPNWAAPISTPGLKGAPR